MVLPHLETLFLQKKFQNKTQNPLGTPNGFFYASKHLPEKVDNIGQTVGINHEGKGLSQNDDGHIALETHLGQGSQHTEKVSWTNGPNHHKDKETVKTIALIQPTDVLVVGALADDRLDKGSSVEAYQIKDNGTANHNPDIVVDSPDDVPVDKDPSY